MTGDLVGGASAVVADAAAAPVLARLACVKPAETAAFVILAVLVVALIVLYAVEVAA